MASPNGEEAQFAGGGETSPGSVEVIHLRPDLFSLVILTSGAAFLGCFAVFGILVAFGLRQGGWVAEVDSSAVFAALGLLALALPGFWAAFYHLRYELVLDDAALTVTLHGKGWRASWNEIADIRADEPWRALWVAGDRGLRRRRPRVVVAVTTHRGVEERWIDLFQYPNLGADELASKLRRRRAKALGLADPGAGYTADPLQTLPRSYAVVLYITLGIMVALPVAAVLLTHLARAD